MLGTRRVTDVEAAVAAAEEIGYPVVLKSTAPWLRDRRDLGGMRFDLADAEDVRSLARLRAKVRAASLLSVSAAWAASTGATVVAEAAMSKVAVSELRYDLARAAVDLLGADGLLTEHDPEAPAGGQFERMLRHSYITLFTAGANDVQRDLVARLALGLPRSSP